MLEHSSGFPRARSLLQTEARSSGLERTSTAAGEPDVFPSGLDGARLNAIREQLCEGRHADVVAVHEVAARAGSYATWPEGLDPRLLAALARRGVTRPYAHQAEAIAAARAGQDVVLATATASGKSLCFHAPIVQAALEDPRSRALLLFPTKALARDQVRSLRALVAEVGPGLVGAGVYDGDTPPEERKAARTRAHVVATNPDMLHRGILPHHDRWAPLLASLRYVVLDELHMYRGVFGSHVANVLRRLWRVCAHHGARPTVICCSATIHNPRELAAAVTGRPDFVLVDRDGAPAGPRTFVVLNPKVVDPATGVRRDYLKVTRAVTSVFRAAGVATLAFCRTRKGVELLTRYLREDEAGVTPGQPVGVDAAAQARAEAAKKKIRGYRGGYLPERRREVEQALQDGEAQVVATTHALELGMDIGGLDAVVLAGYPGTRAATMQRAGRAGRRLSPSLTALVLSSDPLDQFIAATPGFLFDEPPERAQVDPDNPEILIPHLRCAAYELPIALPPEGAPEAAATVVYPGIAAGELGPALAYLAERGALHGERGADGSARYFTIGDAFPADKVDLRGGLEENFTVLEVAPGLASDGRILAEVDFEDGPLYLHPGAIYSVEGTTYEVLRLDWQPRKAYVREVKATYYTEAISQVKVRLVEPIASDPERGRGLGYAHLVRTVPGFKKLRFRTHENVGAGPVHLPDLELHTLAVHFTFGEWAQALLPDAGRRAAAALALGHALHHCAAMLLMCDVHDLGHAVVAGGAEAGAWAPVIAARSGRVSADAALHAGAAPCLLLYDNMPGGAGLASQAYALGAELFERVIAAVTGCRCANGCPTCLGVHGAGELPGEVVRATPAEPPGLTGLASRIAAMQSLPGQVHHVGPGRPAPERRVSLRADALALLMALRDRLRGAA
jgi:DEAD/DEAH box helicase domain-containing protein